MPSTDLTQSNRYKIQHVKIQLLGLTNKGADKSFIFTPKTSDDLDFNDLIIESVNTTIIENKINRSSTTLNMRACGATDIPSSLLEDPQYAHYWAQLHTLDCSDNSISALPKNIAILQNLKVLHCQKNPFIKLPFGLKRLPSLTELTYPDDLQIPAELKEIPALARSSGDVSLVIPPVSETRDTKASTAHASWYLSTPIRPPVIHVAAESSAAAGPRTGSYTPRFNSVSLPPKMPIPINAPRHYGHLVIWKQQQGNNAENCPDIPATEKDYYRGVEAAIDKVKPPQLKYLHMWIRKAPGNSAYNCPLGLEKDCAFYAGYLATESAIQASKRLSP